MKKRLTQQISNTRKIWHKAAEDVAYTQKTFVMSGHLPVSAGLKLQSLVLSLRGAQ